VTPLNPDLAGYFGGEEGLLVLQVIPGSPAAEAGFVAGDIITRMGDRRVLDVEQARAALERSPRGPIPVTLVRRGRSVLVDLPR
jgi:serine protease Do